MVAQEEEIENMFDDRQECRKTQILVGNYDDKAGNHKSNCIGGVADPPKQNEDPKLGLSRVRLGLDSTVSE